MRLCSDTYRYVATGFGNDEQSKSKRCRHQVLTNSNATVVICTTRCGGESEGASAGRYCICLDTLVETDRLARVRHRGGVQRYGA